MRNSKLERQNERLIMFWVALLLISIFVTWFMVRVFDTTDRVNTTGFNTARASFSGAVSLLHAQWQMEGRRSPISFDKLRLRGTGLDDVEIEKVSSVLIPMNSDGWPVSTQNSGAGCIELWKWLTNDASMDKLGNITVNYSDKTQGNNLQKCRYQLDNTLFFEYYMGNGSVSAVKEIEINN